MVPARLRPKVLEALRHGPLEVSALCEELDAASWFVRHALSDLKREKLAIQRTDHRWSLTRDGHTEAAAADQLQLGGAA